MSDSELEDLRQWKKSALTVFNSYDAQKLAKLLGMPLGVGIMPNLQPAIEKLLARVAELEKTVTAALTVTDTWAHKYEEQTEELEEKNEMIRALEESNNNIAELTGIAARRFKRAEVTLRKIKEAYEARSELFTSDAECAQNMADWATLALKEREKP